MPNVMPSREPSAGTMVRDRLTLQVGVVAQVKAGGWRLVRFLNGEECMRRSGNLAHLEENAQQSSALITMAQELGAVKRPYLEDSSDVNTLSPPLAKRIKPAKESTRDETNVILSGNLYNNAASNGLSSVHSSSKNQVDIKKKKKKTTKKKLCIQTSSHNKEEKSKTENQFPNLEPSLWKVVKCKNTGNIGMVIQVKCSGWRVVRTLQGQDLIRRPAQLEYAPTSIYAQFAPMRAALVKKEAEIEAQQRQKNKICGAQLSHCQFFQSAQPNDNKDWQSEQAQHPVDFSDKDDFILRLKFEDGTCAEQPWPLLSKSSQFTVDDHPQNLIGRRFVSSDGRSACVTGYSKRADRDAALLLVQFTDKSHANKKQTTLASSPRTALAAASMTTLASQSTFLQQTLAAGITPPSIPYNAQHTIDATKKPSTPRGASHPAVTPAESTDELVSNTDDIIKKELQ